MDEMNKLNQVLLDSLPHWAMLIEVKTRTILAANKLAIDGGARINCQCWDDFGHRQFISEEHKKIIVNDPDRKRDNTIKCDFCLADEAMEAGKPTRKEVEIEGYISKHSTAQFSHGICPECAKKLYPDLDILTE